jgi:crossover junction endodeoxyribonuclease RuvC
MTKKALRVLGIDPGSIVAGYGIVERYPSRIIHVDNGLLIAKKKLHLAARLRLIYEQLVNVVEQFRPDVVAVEEVFFSKNARAALSLGHSRGVILLAAAQYDIPVAEYAPKRIKKTVVGTGRADKLQVQMMVKTLLGLPEIPAEDAADALATAICHCHHETEISIGDRFATRAGRQ